MRIRPKLVRGYVWDFDGPIALSFIEGIKLLVPLARKRGYPFNARILKYLFRNWGRRGVHLLQVAFGISFEAADELYGKWSELERLQPYAIVPGVRDTLAEICDRGGMNAILTSRPNDSFRLSFDPMDIEQFFTYIGTACDMDFHKPDLRSVDGPMDAFKAHGIREDECTMIGDTFVDADTMRNRNILGFLVETGPYGYFTQRPFGKARIIPSSAHLLPRLEQLGYAIGA